ncbi:MAG TPA: T9SS type A sorting domain-containing protein, partial [Ignavibacteria bacterium]
TKIKFELPSGFPIGAYGNDKVVLKVFDITGREIATLVNEQLAPGTYEVDWNASEYPSGIYFYKLTSGNFTATKKLVLLK